MALVNLKSRLADYRGPVNYFPDESSGAQGFTENMTQTQFTGVAGQENNYTYTYPSLVSDGRLQAQKIITSPGQVANTSTPGTINQSNLPGIDNTALSFTYPSNVKDGRLWRPDAKSQAFPGGQNFIDDLRSGAKGFTLNVNESQFLGITNGTFTYPSSVLPIHKNSVQSVPTANSKFDQGTATLDNQLGAGSKFYYLKDGAANSKIFTQFGYNTSKRYNNSVQSLRGQIEKSLLAQKSIEENSPSALTEQYKKFNLQDDSFNPTGINFLPAVSDFGKQPFVLRGIQRKENPEPQRWGVNGLLSLDSGLIRGGAATAAERAAVDGDRLTRWLTSSAGQFWNIKQIGLGLSNPQVETIAGPLTRLTRVHLGVTSLASATGAAFGLHFDKYGLGVPYANFESRYGYIQKVKQNRQTSDAIIERRFNNGAGNRLAHLRKELDLKNEYPDLKPEALKHQAGLRILSLSGIGGAGSLYGIGVTDIRRYVDTRTSALQNAKRYGSYIPVYSVAAQYRADLAGRKYSTSIDKIKNQDLFKKVLDSIQDLGFAPRITDLITDAKFDNTSDKSILARLERYSTKATITSTPGASESGQNRRIDSAQARADFGHGTAPSTGIHNYATVAYKRIPNRKTGEYINTERRTAHLNSELIDFRELIKPNVASGMKFAQPTSKNYYQEFNLTKKYGFGIQGQVGNNNEQRGSKSFNSAEVLQGSKSSMHFLSTLSSFRGDKITAIDVVRRSEPLIDGKDKIYPDGVRDLIEFYFEDGDSAKFGTSGNRYTVMPFRATITGLSDSFNPSWNNIAIMGRPDGAYLYSSFERQLSFTFTVAATSRAEMIPMWRKLNYLASYTMPDFTNSTQGKPSGPFMRLTLGDMFKQCPGFLNSLTYTVPDEASWDIADDYNNDNKIPKQLPTVIEVSVGYTVIHDKRPQLYGNVYYINSWIKDADSETAKTDQLTKSEQIAIEAEAILNEIANQEQAEIAQQEALEESRTEQGINNYLQF